jgi:hypothetical protein
VRGRKGEREIQRGGVERECEMEEGGGGCVRGGERNKKRRGRERE